MKEDIYTIYQSESTKDIISFTICGITYPDKTYEIYREKSKTACIEYIEEGKGTVNVNNSSFTPVKGDSYFLRAGEKHHYFSDKTTPWKKYFINLSGTLLDSLTDGYLLKENHHFPGLDTKEELCRIIDLAKDKESDNSNEIISIVNQILLKMHNSLNNLSDTPTTAEKMKNYINAHASEKFKIEDLCKHINRSESQAIRLFKNAYGITPYTYILDKKIHIAQNLLINTNLSIKEIAFKLSFSDEYYFSNVFKSKTRMSPSSFRNKKNL